MVPATFVPKPEDYAPQINQELRSQQSHWSRGYTLAQVEFLESQLHKAHFKRTIYKLDDGYSEAQAEALLVEDIKVARTARTIMLDRISEWAGAYGKEEFEHMLPDVWDKFIKEVKGEPAPEVADDTEDTPVPPTPETHPDEFGDGVTPQNPKVSEEEALAPEEELEAVQVIERPEVPADLSPSEVKAPDEVSLGDVLGKVSEDNSND